MLAFGLCAYTTLQTLFYIFERKPLTRMNKSELIQKMAATAGVTQENAGRVLDAFLKTVEDELASKGSVSLVGFGSFGVAHRAARTGRNPLTGGALNIPGRNAVKFTPGKALKDAVNA